MVVSNIYRELGALAGHVDPNITPGRTVPRYEDNRGNVLVGYVYTGAVRTLLIGRHYLRSALEENGHAPVCQWAILTG